MDICVCVYSAHNTHKHKHTVGKEKKNLTKTELNIIIVVVHIKHECIGLVNTYSSRFLLLVGLLDSFWFMASFTHHFRPLEYFSGSLLL